MMAVRALLVAVAVAAFAVVAADPLGPYKVDPSKITVGGLSAGAFMAVQMHVAFSSNFSGCAAFAGGPYDCAGDSELVALTSCTKPNLVYKAPNATDLVFTTHLAYDTKAIDNPVNVKGKPVYLYSGLLDSVVARPVMTSLEKYYTLLGAEVTTEFDILSEHTYPTVSYGEGCTTLGEPYISKCNYDGAGISLATLYGTLKPSVTSVAANLMSFQQSRFTPSPSSISMNSMGYVYVPTACKSGATCAVHVSLHGCEQTLSDIQTDYVAHVGLNEWAESNNIIVVYPQIVRDILKGNPLGCWDWWGYTQSNYASKKGPQMEAVMGIVNFIAGIAA